jgi:hypothetical protein
MRSAVPSRHPSEQDLNIQTRCKLHVYAIDDECNRDVTKDSCVRPIDTQRHNDNNAAPTVEQEADDRSHESC